MLIKLANAAFKKASWLVTIDTSRYMCPLADNLRNVAPPAGESPNTYVGIQEAVKAVQEDIEEARTGLSTDTPGKPLCPAI